MLAPILILDEDGITPELEVVAISAGGGFPAALRVSSLGELGIDDGDKGDRHDDMNFEGGHNEVVRIELQPWGRGRRRVTPARS